MLMEKLCNLDIKYRINNAMCQRINFMEIYIGIPKLSVFIKEEDANNALLPFNIFNAFKRGSQ